MRAPLAHVVLGTLLVGCVASAANAGDFARVTVPFPFQVNNRMLPAGQYEIRTNEDDPAVVMIEGLDHPAAHADVITISETRRDHTDAAPALTFVRRDGVMVLSEFLESGDEAREILLRNPR